jgi:hypothetical protein
MADPCCQNQVSDGRVTEFGCWSWRFENFVRFVNSGLLPRAKVNLHTFQLHWDNDSYLNCSDARMWIGYAARLNNVNARTHIGTIYLSLRIHLHLSSRARIAVGKRLL